MAAKFKVGDKVTHKLGHPVGIVVEVIEPEPVECEKPCRHCEVANRHRRYKPVTTYNIRVSAKGADPLATVKGLVESELVAG